MTDRQTDIERGKFIASSDPILSARKFSFLHPFWQMLGCLPNSYCPFFLADRALIKSQGPPPLLRMQGYTWYSRPIMVTQVPLLGTGLVFGRKAVLLNEIRWIVSLDTTGKGFTSWNKGTQEKNIPSFVSRMSEVAAAVLKPCRQLTKIDRVGRWREPRLNH